MFPALISVHLFLAALTVDPFAFLGPSVTITKDERRQLDRGEPIARVLSGKGREIAAFAAVPVKVDGDRVVAWIRCIEQLRKSSYVVAVARFSDPPRIEDLAGLVLDDDDLSDIRTCRPQDCGLQLSAQEMIRLETAAAEATGDWKEAVQQAFREALLERVRVYLASGEISGYDDSGSRAPSPASRFGSLLDHSLFLTKRLPQFAEHLRAYPSGAAPEVESFVYWSKERLGGRPFINVTHLSILRGQGPGLPDALVAGKQIFASHYIDASLGVTALLRGAWGGPNYLVYVNRSELGILGGPFGGLIKWFMKRRLKAEAAGVLRELRQRLESGDPPPVVTSTDESGRRHPC